MAVLDDALTDLRQTVAALQRELDERTAELASRAAELRESEQRYGLVIQAVAEGIYEWDIERNSLWPSARLIEIFGFHGRDLTAADWNELVHPEDFSHYRAALRDCFKAVTPQLDCEYRVRHSDGTYRWIEDRAVPVRNAAGRAIRLTGAITDISERKAADQALREALSQQTATAVDESLNLAYHGARAQDQNFNIILERDLDFSIAPLDLVPQDVTRVFLNLFGNGFYAANKRCNDAHNPKLKPSLRVTTRDLGVEVEIRVRDNGAGIAPEIKEKLFQPFFTTKPPGEGTGLGLSISYDIVTQHGGTITVDSREGEFTEFTVCLPRFRQPATAGNTA